MLGPGAPRPPSSRNTRLQSERKRRNALSSAFQELRSLLPADVQRATKSQVVSFLLGLLYHSETGQLPVADFEYQLEGAVDAIKRARMERDRYRHLLESLRAEKGIANQADEFLLPPMPTPN